MRSISPTWAFGSTGAGASGALTSAGGMAFKEASRLSSVLWHCARVPATWARWTGLVHMERSRRHQYRTPSGAVSPANRQIRPRMEFCIGHGGSSRDRRVEDGNLTAEDIRLDKALQTRLNLMSDEYIKWPTAVPTVFSVCSNYLKV